MEKRKQRLLTALPRPPRPPLGQRLRERDPKERRCGLDECNRAFKPHREWQKFCSTKCRYRAWELDNPRVRLRR